MAQIIKIKRGTISSLVSSTPTLQQGELLLATGSVNGLGSTFFVADDANSPELPYAKVESISDGSALASSLDGNFEGLLIHSSSDNKFYRYNGTAFVELPVAAGSFVGTLPVANGGTNATSFADKAVIISQDSGTDTLSALALTTNGSLVIGGTSGPAAATLTAGEGIDITNADGSITILGEDASTTNKGIVELATDNEVSTGSDTSRAITPSSLSVATVATASYVSGSNVDGSVASAAIASLALNATNAANVDINNVSGDTEYGLIFRDGNTDGNQALYADNELDQPSYNPSTNTIKTPIISASSALYVGGNITVTGTVDGRDLATDGSKLDGIASFTASLDPDIVTLSLPSSTTISAFGKTLVDDADAATARTTLGVDAAGTDNSTDVTLAGSLDYITISGQIITRNAINVSTDLNVTPTATGLAVFTGSNAAAIRTTLGVDAAGTDNSTDVTLAGSYDYITISGQTITRNQVDASTDISNLTTTNVSEGTNLYYTDARVKTKLNSEGVISGSTMSPTFAGLTVTGDVSVQGSLTTVNSNEVNLGDRIITLNTADSAGDAGIQVHDTSTAETGSLLWDTDGNYWKVGVVGGTDYRLVEWDGETAGTNNFIHTDSDGRINAINTTTDGDILVSNGAGTFTATNVIDGGTF